MYLMGIDIGTSSTKTAIFDLKGKVLACASCPYVFESVRSGYAEQDPQVWWEATVKSIRGAMEKAGISPEHIRGIGLSGQMHGLVPLDAKQRLVRKAILHCDLRAGEEAAQISATFKGIEDIVCNPIFPGFQLTTLCWMKAHEQDRYATIAHVMCPKDYVRYRMTGVIGTEHTDASGTLLYDNINCRWADDIFDRLEIRRDIVADYIGSSYEIAGRLTAEAAQAVGLATGTPVVFGGADQAMQALGNAVYAPGITMMTIGTSGQVLAVTPRPVSNGKHSIHVFRHAEPDRWYSLGAVLFAGSTLNWFRRNFAPEASFEDLSAMAEGVPPCSHGLVFLPCMGGERTPYLDPLARGVFSGITMLHDRACFSRAIMEGVAFAMKSAMAEIDTAIGPGRDLICAGGGVKGDTWARIQADIYGRDILASRIKEQACLGAAICAGIGVGAFSGAAEGCAAMCDREMRRILPREANVPVYQRFYEAVYSRLYEANAATFREMSAFA